MSERVISVVAALVRDKAGRFLLGGLEHRAVVGADQPQIVCATALHEAQVAGVIDDAGKIRVLVIDAHLLHVLAVDDGTIEMGRHQSIRAIGNT